MRGREKPLGTMDLELLRRVVGHRLADAEFHFHRETGSTNDEALRLARSGAPEWTTVFADAQSAGRGRRGARWCGKPGSDLLLSIVLRPDIARNRAGRLTLLAALAVRRAIRECTDLRPQVKWPNDLVLEGRKLAGILVESHGLPAAQGDVAILGIGLNVNGTLDDFPPDLRSTATSLRIASDQGTLSREGVAAAILIAFADLYPAAAADDDLFADALGEIRRHSSLLGREVMVTIGRDRFTAIARDLGPSGELLVDSPERGPMTLHTVDLIRPLDSP